MDILLTDIIFLICSVLAIIFSLLVVISRNPIYSSLFLVGSFIPIAVIYILMYAPFIAAIQIIVYAGAIMVLFTFVIMMVYIDRENIKIDKSKGFRILSIFFVVGFLLTFLLSNIISDKSYNPNPDEDFGSTKAIGKLIFGLPDNTLESTQVISFELTSILIMVAIIGALVLAKKRT